MAPSERVVVVDCKQCGRQGVGASDELRRFGWRMVVPSACPACQGLPSAADGVTGPSAAARSTAV